MATAYAAAGASAPGGSRGLAVAVASFAIVMVDGYDTLMISYIAPLLAHGWRLKPTQIGEIFAWSYLGAIVGALLMGALSDRFGRKRVLTAAMALAGLATLACAAAPNLQALLALRFLSGIALGGALPAVISLTAEHARPERRSATVTLMYIGYPLGAVAGGFVTAAFLGAGWPALFVATGVACLLAAVVAATLPEPPALAADTSRAPVRGPGLVSALGEGRLAPAVLLWIGLFCMLLLTYFLVSWTPTILVGLGVSPKGAALGGALLNLGGAVGAVAMAPLVARFGPYRPIAALLLAGAALVFLFGQQLGTAATGFLLLAGCGACVVGGQLNVPAMVVDLFPPRVRGAGGGWTIAFGRLGSIAGPLLGGVLLARHMPVGGIFALATIPALCAATALFAASILRRRAVG